MTVRDAKHMIGLQNVLVVDPDPQVAQCLIEVLSQRGIRAHVVDRPRAAVEFIDRHSCAMAFLGLSQVLGTPGLDHELLRQLRINQPELPIYIMAGPDELPLIPATDDTPIGDVLLRSTTQLVQAVAHAGCNGCLIKPLNRLDLVAVLESHLPSRQVAQVAGAEEAGQSLFRIVGQSTSMTQVVELAERIAPTSAPVLISGESGCGKELVAGLIHHRSRRGLGPYVKVNCAALSDSLLESELFGHEKGAFTGALNRRKGRFEQAHGGTLLLDEITETPAHFQAKLLRIIEEQEFERVGGNENVRVNVRIISTTNRDLLEEVRQGRFRQDLYYRLSATRLVVPPLRQRPQDLTDLIWYFINLYAVESQRSITELDPVMLGMFQQYDWPGNVRQLRNVVRTSLILGTGSTLSLTDVSWLFDGAAVPTTPQAPVALPQTTEPMITPLSPVTSSVSEPTTDLGGLPLEVVERRAILDTLKQTDGNRKKAAEVLGISDRTLRERIRRYKEQLCLQSA